MHTDRCWRHIGRAFSEFDHHNGTYYDNDNDNDNDHHDHDHDHDHGPPNHDDSRRAPRYRS